MATVVVTGIGCVTPIGIGVTAFAAALRAGASGTGAVTGIDSSALRCRVAAQVQNFVPRDFMPLREATASPRVVQFAVAAAQLARSDARLAEWTDRTRVGVVIGSSVGPSVYNFEQFGIFLERGARRMHPSFPAQAHYGVIASECAIQCKIHGPAMVLSSACTSGADAIGVAHGLVAGGTLDVALAGGAEAPICSLLMSAFDRLSMMPRSFNDQPAAASRPFSADREGFVLGEGSAIVVLETLEHALGRGVKPMAELAGYAATCDAHTHFGHAPDGRDAVLAISRALEMARVSPGDLSYVNAHGSATTQNDPFETEVLKAALGVAAHRVPISSSKSMIGHLLGASGAVELAAALVGMREGFVPPTINLETPDPACDLDYVPEVSRVSTIDTALSTSFGFGSRNAAIVIKRWRSD